MARKGLRLDPSARPRLTAWEFIKFLSLFYYSTTNSKPKVNKIPHKKKNRNRKSRSFFFPLLHLPSIQFNKCPPRRVNTQPHHSLSSALCKPFFLQS
ncbi:hypothetical protein L1887_23700 [Cichorium endivia]|nr:hypothetical protein L1887_23700 [Cichorium endivia]